MWELVMSTIAFKDCVLDIGVNTVSVRMGAKGMLFPLPSNVVSYDASKVFKRTCRLRDFESVYGGDADSISRAFDSMSINLTLESGKYIVILLDDGSKVYVIHGRPEWDGDKFGFIIGVVER
jgi:hypothetical protein